MKRSIALLLAALLALALAACGSPAPAPSAPSAPNAPSAPAASDVSTASSAGEDAPVVAPNRGSWQDGVYTNTFAGFTFTLPENWVSLTDAEMAEAFQLGQDYLEDMGEDFSDELLQENTLYEAMVLNITNNSNLIIMYENLAVNPVYGLIITPERYIDILESSVKTMYQTLDYTFGEPESITLGSTDYLKVEVTESSQGITQYYYVTKNGGFIISLICTVNSPDTDATLEACFS